MHGHRPRPALLMFKGPKLFFSKGPLESHDFPAGQSAPASESALKRIVDICVYVNDYRDIAVMIAAINCDSSETRWMSRRKAWIQSINHHLRRTNFTITRSTTCASNDENLQTTYVLWIIRLQVARLIECLLYISIPIMQFVYNQLVCFLNTSITT